MKGWQYVTMNFSGRVSKRGSTAPDAWRRYNDPRSWMCVLDLPSLIVVQWHGTPDPYLLQYIIVWRP